ncbi:MAG: hypothetical protein JSU06_02210 [Actinobacteria bacterium]|nr:hypothetical protein [Actinomycetota bacterium]
MSITLTPAQAVALGPIADEARNPLRLHQIGEDPDVLITWGETGEPRLLLRADGAAEPIDPHPIG